MRSCSRVGHLAVEGLFQAAKAQGVSADARRRCSRDRCRFRWRLYYSKGVLLG